MRFKDFSTNNLFEAISNIPMKNQGGTCYQDAMNYMMAKSKNGNTSILLCHGLVTGQGPIAGIVYGHAWVEKGSTVIDKTVPITLPKQLYYALGNIKESDVYRYTYDEMSHKVTEFGTYGPWEQKLLNNKY